jgi:hypothetical protein
MTPPFGTLVVRLLAFLVTYPFLPSVPTGGPCQNSTSIWSNCQWKKRREWEEFPFFGKLLITTTQKALIHPTYNCHALGDVMDMECSMVDEEKTIKYIIPF